MKKLQHNRLPRLVANKKMNGHKITIECHIVIREGLYAYEYRVRKDGKLITLQPWEDVPDYLKNSHDWAKLEWSEKFFADTICAHWELKHPLPQELLFV